METVANHTPLRKYLGLKKLLAEVIFPFLMSGTCLAKFTGCYTKGKNKTSDFEALFRYINYMK